MPDGEVPQSVLAESLSEQIDGRPVRAAVFTTFSFDPGFFESHVLPLLFDAAFSQVEKIKRIQLEDELRSVGDLAVYYDRTALAQDATPAQLDFDRIGVRGPSGVFHPKLVLVLVENPLERDGEEDDAAEATHEPGPLTLIVGVLSANLTRSGWWENLEVAHFEQIEDRDWTREICPFRRDLMGLLRRLLQTGGPADEQPAMQRILDFLQRRAPTGTKSRNRGGGRYYTRLFWGQKTLPVWLEELGLSRGQWNLEIVSPYFDKDQASTLVRLIDAVDPREVRVFLPRDIDRRALVSDKLYDAVAEHADWSALPSSMTRPGARDRSKDVAPRFVHAKLYRFWRRGHGQIVLVGSVNLTSAAHSRSNSGNLEAAFLVDASDEGIPERWWLNPVEDKPTAFIEQTPEVDDTADRVFVDVSLRFDWCSRKLVYRIDSNSDGPMRIQTAGGADLFEIDKPRVGRWIDCGPDAAHAVETLLKSTSFVQIAHARGTWRVLIREEGMSHRPSLLLSLTPEEILMYWSLLSDAQREAFISEKLDREAALEGLSRKTFRYAAQDTIFDRFAGVHHAFEQLYRRVDDCLERDEPRQAEARLFGAKYDSLPQLLSKTLSDNDDAVMRYMIFLSAHQLADRVRSERREFWRSHRTAATQLTGLLERLPELRAALPLDGDDAGAFVEWYETMFLSLAAAGEPDEAEVH